jgi:type II secretory pathway pseudopilin PulG
MLGVLAIVGVLSVGGIAGYSKAMNKFKVNKTIDQINMIATNIRTLYASQKDYKDLDRYTAKKAGVIPAEMYPINQEDTRWRDTNLAINAFGGVFEVCGVDHYDCADVEDGFYIELTQIPQAACVSIATAEWGADAGAGLIAMQIYPSGGFGGCCDHGNSIQYATAAASLNEVDLKGADHLPFNITDASISCKELNQIFWKFK